MKNYINVRVQSYNYKKQYDLFRHNFRHTKDSLSQINENPNYMIGENKLIEITNENKKRLYDVISEKYKQDRVKHNELYKTKHKRNLRDFQATWTDGILTFSEAIHSDLGTKYSKEDLSKVALNCAHDIAKKYNSELIYLTLHMDETTPHFHFSLKNFDENGLSLWKKNKNKEFLSQLQDIAFKHFKELGMDRGVSKDITGKRYETIQSFYRRKEIALKSQIVDLEAQYNNKKQDIEKSLKALYTEVNLQKNEVKDLRSTYDRTSQEYKDLTTIFKQLQVEEKTLREKVRELKEIDNLDNYLNSLKKDISKIINSNVERVDPLVGSTRIEVKNIKKMYSELVSKISEPLHSKVKEVEEKDKIIKEQSDLISIKDKEIAQKDKVIEKATNDIKKLESAFMVNYKQLEAIKKDFKLKVAKQVRRLNLINRLKNSNIANKIRLRLSKRFKQNGIDR